MTVVCERESLVLPFARAFSQSDACGRRAGAPIERCTCEDGMLSHVSGEGSVRLRSPRRGAYSKVQEPSVTEVGASTSAHVPERQNILNRNAKEK